MARPFDVIAYCWHVNATHPRLIGKHYSGGGERLTLGQRGPWFPTEDPEHLYYVRPWGLTQVWLLANGQEILATWKPKSDEDE